MLLKRCALTSHRRWMALAIGALVCSATTGAAQQRGEWSGGISYLFSRPYDTRVYGVTFRREDRVRGPLVRRFVGSLDVGGDTIFRPSLLTAGVDLGVRVKRGRGSVLAALGPTLVYFVGSRGEATTSCQGGCFDPRPWYTAGPRVAVTGSLAVGLQVSPSARVFYEGRGHFPLRIGRAGYRGDPNAGFVEAAIGLAVTP